MARFSLIPKEEQYFALFRQMTSYIYDAARALVEMLEDKSGNYAGHVAGIKAIEHACDELTHSISTKLNSSFITPFDREDIYEMHRLENEADDLYHAAIAALFRDTNDPLTVIKWKEIYEKLESAVDRCESVAHIIESVIIKHA